MRAVRRGVAEARQPRVHLAERGADGGPQLRRLRVYGNVTCRSPTCKEAKMC